jgi:hypothetical protein
MRQITALGGGGFSMEQENSLLVLDKKPKRRGPSMKLVFEYMMLEPAVEQYEWRNENGNVIFN